MNQREVNRAVAKATGETVRTIGQLGFLLWDLRSNTCSETSTEEQTETNSLCISTEERSCEPSFT